MTLLIPPIGGAAPAASTAASSSGFAPALGAASVGLSVLGMMAAADSARYSADSLKIQLGFQAEMAKINARLNESNAQAALNRANFNYGAIKMRAGQMKSKQRTSMLANGIDINQSDIADSVLTTTDFMGEVDAQQALANGVREAWGYRTNSANMVAEANFKSASANSIDSGMAARTSMIGNAGTVAQNWYMVEKGYGLGTTR